MQINHIGLTRLGTKSVLAIATALALASCGGGGSAGPTAVSDSGAQSAADTANASGSSGNSGTRNAASNLSDGSAGTSGASNSSTGASSAVRYEITLTNLTVGQPLSPMVVLLHHEGYRLFEIGESASEALERLAEGAETEALIRLAQGSAAVVSAEVLNAAPLGPGRSASRTIELSSAEATRGLHLSAATMLVNTNDAFAGLAGHAIGSLAASELLRLDMLSYDSGTEANNELAAQFPGPAGGGEGFNVKRDDLADRVHVHAGVVTADDGLPSSALREIHRWDHPAARLTIRRLN